MIETPAKYQSMVALYREWNDRINVVSRKDIDCLYHHHILHSLAIAEYLRRFYPDVFIAAAGASPEKRLASLDPSQPCGWAPPSYAAEGGTVSWGNPSRRDSVLDLGTGGGFPGIPLAMEFPGADFTLCDSIGKKVRVAQAVADGLGLRNVTCVNARAESLPGPFDWVVSRAVTSLENFYPWVRGKFNRSILYLKGGDVESEIDVLVRKYKLPRGNIRVWKIAEWLENDDYFAEKFVIEIGKNYLCAPNTNN